MPGFKVQSLGESVSSRKDYYYIYTWELPNIIGTGVTVNSPLVHLKDATTPTFVVNKENYVGSALEYKFAKSVTWEDVKVSWYDTVGLIDIIRKWRQSVWTKEDGLLPASSYKKVTSLRCYLPNGKEEYGWKLQDSWPSQIRSGDLTYTNSDVKIVEVTISYDWAEEMTSHVSI